MDVRLQKIVEETQVKFGLEKYRLERSEVYKERDHKGKAFYKFTMEWFPTAQTEEIEEDMNPDGAAIIDYNIQAEQFVSVIFVQGVSFSTIIHFPTKTSEEVSAWLERETGLSCGNDFKLVEEQANYFRYEMDIDGVRMSPNFTIEVRFDDAGKLTTYHRNGLIPKDEEIEKSTFTLTLEEIEPLVKKQLQLIHFPSEEENRILPVYAMEEVFFKVEDARIIPFMEHERTQVNINEVIEWSEPINGKLIRKELSYLHVASAADAFDNVDVDNSLTLTAEQIERSKKAVCDAFRTELPNEAGRWQLEKLHYQEDFIEAHCRRNDDESGPFKRKVVVFIHPENMSVLNLIDNEALAEIWDSFAPAEKAVVTHDEAFEKLLSYISLEPTYVYDTVAGKYILCGLLDAAEGISAVTGDVVPLSEL